MTKLNFNDYLKDLMSKDRRKVNVPLRVMPYISLLRKGNWWIHILNHNSVSTSSFVCPIAVLWIIKLVVYWEVLVSIIRERNDIFWKTIKTR